jgi:alpha-tubulin suppressor-like RCC1 family protein
MKSRYICISITTLLSLGFSLPTAHAQTTQAQVAAGTNHSLVLTENGEVYGFGRNDLGALGLGDANRVDIPRLAGHPNLAGKTIIDVVPGGGDSSLSYMLILTADGQFFSFGFTSSGQTLLPGVTPAQDPESAGVLQPP